MRPIIAKEEKGSRSGHRARFMVNFDLRETYVSEDTVLTRDILQRVTRYYRLRTTTGKLRGNQGKNKILKKVNRLISEAWNRVLNGKSIVFSC